MFLVAIALLVVSSGIVLAEPVALAYKFVPGAIDKYKMSMSMDLNLVGAPQGRQMPPANMRMSMVVTEKTLGVLPDGSAKIRVSYSGFKMEGNPAMKVKGKMPKVPGRSDYHHHPRHRRPAAQGRRAQQAVPNTRQVHRHGTVHEDDG